MHGEIFLHYYRISGSLRPGQDGSKTTTEPVRASAAKRLVHSISEPASIGVMTDYHSFLVLFSRSKRDRDSGSPTSEPNCGVTMNLHGSVQWWEILQLLHSGDAPKEGGKKDIRLDILNSVMSQWRPSNDLRNTRIRSLSLPLFELQRRTVKSTKPRNTEEQNLAAIVEGYLSSDPENFHGLELFLKGLRIQLAQPRERSRVYSSEARKTVVGLARPGDGRKSKMSRPPRVATFGCGSNDVSFNFKAQSGGRTTAALDAGKLHTGYITVAHYFNAYKGQGIQKPHLPLVNVGTRSKPTYYPLELLTLVARPQGSNGSTLSFGDVLGIVGTAHTPKMANSFGGKCELRYPGLKMLLANSLIDCQVSVKPQSLLCPSRIKYGPTIRYTKGEEIRTIAGKWNMQSVVVTPGQTKSKVAVLIIGTNHWIEEQRVLDSCKKLQKRLKAHGLDVDTTESLKKVVMATHQLSVEAVKGQVNTELTSIVRDKCNAVVILLPFKVQSLYHYIKRQCDIEYGIHSMCIVAPKFAENDNRNFFQLALKLNLKTGGQNQRLKSDEQQILNRKNTMIVGVKVVLPPKQIYGNAKGFIGMVTSIDEARSQWPAVGEVLGEGSLPWTFVTLLKARIDLWKKDLPRKDLPHDIIIYYDGLADRALLDAIREYQPPGQGL